MSHPPTRLIDCSVRTDLMAGWPMGRAVGKFVCASDTASALMADLSEEWVFESADLDGRGFEIQNNNIVIDTGGLTPVAVLRSRHFQYVITVRVLEALRAAWQSEHIQDTFEIHRPDLWLLLGRICAADSTTMLARMVYEIRKAGFEGLWRHTLGSDAGDVINAYESMPIQAFTQWFKKETRVSVCDFETLADMDDMISDLTFEGVGRINAATVRAMTVDPATGASYLGGLAHEIAENPAWCNITNPLVQAHFFQINQEIGATRIGHVATRDKKLAARLFPDSLVRA